MRVKSLSRLSQFYLSPMRVKTWLSNLKLLVCSVALISLDETMTLLMLAWVGFLP